jgi:UDP-glucose 4-epimerase
VTGDRLPRETYGDVPLPSGQTILVTGGAGFIGSHLVDALAPDNEVRVLDTFTTGKRERVPQGVTLVEGDLRDATAIETATDGVDVVFHQAGLVSVERSIEDPQTSHAVNAGGTIALLEAARRNDARVVAASSCAIYGQPESVPIPETAPTAPTSPYAADKLTLDHYVRLYHDRYGLPTVALRYFNVYGPRQTGGEYSGVVSIFLRQARDGGPLTVEGDGDQTRDFVFVGDVVRANLLAAATDATGRAFNVGTGVETSILELAETVVGVTGTDAAIEHVDPRPGDIERSRADLTRARAELGYEPTTDLADGLATLVEK